MTYSKTGIIRRKGGAAARRKAKKESIANANKHKQRLNSKKLPIVDIGTGSTVGGGVRVSAFSRNGKPVRAFIRKRPSK